MRKRLIYLGFFACLLIVGGWGIYRYLGLQKPKTDLVNGVNVNPVSYSDKRFLAELKDNYPKVYERLYNGGDQSRYVIPGLEQTKAIIHSGKKKGKVGIAKDMDPQGMAVIGDQYLIISAYSKSKTYNSVLWLLDKETGKYLKTIALDDIDHVGAITYDKHHQRLWVATVDKEKDAQVEALNLATIEAYDLDKYQKPIVFDEVTDLSDVKLASYMAYHDQVLYVGYFNKQKSGILAAFPMDSQGKLIDQKTDTSGVEPVKTWQTASQIQGISFYEDKILMSQSYGAKDSRLYIFDNRLGQAGFDLDKKDALTSLALPPYLEQVVGHDDQVYLLFESASHKYRRKSRLIHMDRVIKLKIEDTLQK